MACNIGAPQTALQLETHGVSERLRVCKADNEKDVMNIGHGSVKKDVIPNVVMLKMSS